MSRKLFNAILIANRGEIACRIVRACREMGIRSVAVYSDADARALHTRLADDAIHLGAAPARESYLDIDRIIGAARQAGVDAIHPGYGFLAENAAFAQAVSDAGMTFIGPPPAAIQLMGDKIAARALAAREGIATVPGFSLSDQEFGEMLLTKANEIGYPLLIKAAAGGGGRGMRPVQHERDFMSMIESAQREARSAFGDGRVYVEKLIQQPRHIEVQVIADMQGHVAHLFERECSIQRRHQKIIEESPSPFVDVDLRNRLCDAAMRLARVVGYMNAGTIEFIVDGAGAIYFLEMNTRLQVEHPVTELVVDVDLVQAQIHIAAGEPLSEVFAAPLPVAPSGHAIECRICAEDAANGFIPSVGRITKWVEPRGVRVDAGYGAGDAVPMHYDSLLAKVIAHGATRTEAIAKMKAALAQFEIEGVTTNAAFLREVIGHPAFARGETTTDFLPQYFAAWQPRSVDDEVPAPAQPATSNPWLQPNRFRIGEGNTTQQTAAPAAPRAKPAPASSRAHPAGDRIEAPMPAMVRQVMARAGDVVKRGDALMVLEAMKMELRLVAPRDGVVKSVGCEVGQSVERGQVLIDM